MSDVTRSSSDALRNRESGTNVDELNFIEIDLVEKARNLWAGRRLIMMITAVFLVIGLFHYTFAPAEYLSTATLIQEAEGGMSFDGGGLLRTLAGGNFQAGGGNLAAAASGRAPLPPTLYPAIVTSTDFQKELVHTPVEFSLTDTTMSLYSYFNDHYEVPFRSKVYGFIGDMTIFLPRTLFRWARGTLRSVRNVFRSGSGNNELQEEGEELEPLVVDENGNIMYLTNQERNVIERMRLRILLDTAGGLITISTELPDPKAAAEVNALVVEKMQGFITDYRLEKARQNLAAVQQQAEEARLRYEEADMELATYMDQNINLTTNVAQIRSQYLQNQRNLRFSVYNSMAQEVEQARMSLEQQIPVFSTLEKSNLPVAPATGSSNIVLVFSVILGLFIGIGVVLVKNSSIFVKKQ